MMATVFPRPDFEDNSYALSEVIEGRIMVTTFNNRMAALKDFAASANFGFECLLQYKDDATGQVDTVAFFPGLHRYPK